MGKPNKWLLMLLKLPLPLPLPLVELLSPTLSPQADVSDLWEMLLEQPLLKPNKWLLMLLKPNMWLLMLLKLPLPLPLPLVELLSPTLSPQVDVSEWWEMLLEQSLLKPNKRLLMLLKLPVPLP